MDFFRLPRTVESCFRRTDLLAVLLLGLVYGALGLLSHPILPLPTDDLLYLDASFRLSRGTYPQVDSNFPYHHYLRWPVVVPIAILVRLIGYGPYTLTVYFILSSWAMGALSFMLLRSLSVTVIGAFLGGLTPIVLFPLFVPLALRADPIATLWSLLAVLFAVLGSSGAGTLGLVVGAGISLGLACLAHQVSVFLLPGVALLLWKRSSSFLRSLVALGVGLGSMLLLSTSLDWFLFGDPLTTLKVIQQWHLSAVPEWSWVRYLTDWRERAFIFGFIVNLLNTDSLLLSIAACSLLVVIFRRDQENRRLLIFVGLVTLLTLEVLGSALLDKVYLRFISTALFLVILGTISVDLRRSDKLFSFGRHFLEVVIVGLACFHVWSSVTKETVADEWLDFYRLPMEFILADGQSQLDRNRAVWVDFEEENVPALIPWIWAVSAYSYYRLSFGGRNPTLSCAENRHDGAETYLVTLSLLPQSSKCSLRQTFSFTKDRKLFVYRKRVRAR